MLTGSGAPPVAALLFGIDVVHLARAQQLLDRFGHSVGDRVATTEEAAWIGDVPARLGAVLGIKEATIKAMGGRPEPFAWQQIHVNAHDPQVILAAAGAVAVPGWPDSVAEMFGEFAAGTGLEQVAAVSCSVYGSCLTRMLDQLAAPRKVHGAACFGTREGHVFAAACFWRDDDE